MRTPPSWRSRSPATDRSWPQPTEVGRRPGGGHLMGPGRGFNDLHRCLPRISRSMLADRLRRLERAGVVTRTPHGSGRVVEYRLTEAGRELESLLLALGDWSVRRLFGDPMPEQLDPAMLAFRMSEKVDAARLPPNRTVVELRCRRPDSAAVAAPRPSFHVLQPRQHEGQRRLRRSRSPRRRRRAALQWFIGSYVLAFAERRCCSPPTRSPTSSSRATRCRRSGCSRPARCRGVAPRRAVR